VVGEGPEGDAGGGGDTTVGDRGDAAGGDQLQGGAEHALACPHGVVATAGAESAARIGAILTRAERAFLRARARVTLFRNTNYPLRPLLVSLLSGRGDGHAGNVLRTA
jgi:hypothetical protein